MVNTENKSGNISKMRYKLGNKQDRIVSDKRVSKINKQDIKVSKIK
ncbi:MAG TPA: hypothetical protein HA262_13330 [Methanosarcina sp.]|nr:hypothetical protein [Methanosarcina sp.]